MAEQERNESFFRKVVRFVANPATDWADLNSRQEETKELELEKSELKAMIERKRRNDFVRKREFDMLRKVRREGLSPEQLAAIGSSSRLDDSEGRSEAAAARPDGVKAKIDEIEQQMVGEGGFSPPAALPAPPAPPRRIATEASNRASAFPPPSPWTPASQPATSAPPMEFDRPPPRPARSAGAEARTPAPAPIPREPQPQLQPPPVPRTANQVPDIRLPPATAPAPVQMVSGLPPLAPLSTVSFDTPSTPAQTSARAERVAQEPETPPDPMAPGGPATDFSSPFAVEVSEVMHDPELDEAVIA
ncbi:MAG: hypothetical protein LW712_10220, partial [Burkholderiaceae bacterium]|nr:hypothetical protein [Burkholderiaceae bacterium]